MLPEITGPIPDQHDFQNISKKIDETLHKYSELSLGYKVATVALTILSLPFFIIPAIFVFNYAVQTFHEWQVSAAKNIAENVDQTQTVQPPAPKPDPVIDLPKPTEQQPKAETPSPAPAPVPEVKNEEPPVLMHQKIHLKFLACNMSEDEAEDLLRTDTNPGDYIIFKGEYPDWSNILFVDENKKIVKMRIYHTGDDSSNYYGLTANSGAFCDSLQQLSFLKNPIHPGATKENKVIIQNAVKDFYYIVTLKYLENAKLSQYTNDLYYGLDTPLDLDGLLSWIEKTPNVLIKEKLSTKAFPFFARAFGHVFGLKGEISLDDTKVKLEGFHYPLAKTLVGSFQQKHLQDTELLTKDVKDNYQASIDLNCHYQSKTDISDEEYAKEIYQDIKDGKVISIATGYKKHATNLTISENFLYYTNRGDRIRKADGTYRQAGTYVYKINDFSKFNAKLIERYLNQEALQDETYLLKALEEDLLTGRIEKYNGFDYHEFKDQRVGNCTFVSNITGSWAMTFGYSYADKPDGGLANHIQFATKFYKELRIHNKTTMMDYWKRLQNLLPEKHRKEHLHITQELNKLIFSKKSAKFEEKYQVMNQHAHEIMSQCTIPLNAILPSKTFKNDISYLLDEHPQGTFAFYKFQDPTSPYTHKIALNKKDILHPEDFEINLSEENGCYRLTIFCKKTKGVEVHTEQNIKTIGQLVTAVKTITGIELRFNIKLGT